VFAGCDEQLTHAPVACPTASGPQAWAAGAPLLLLTTTLGLVPIGGAPCRGAHLPPEFGAVAPLGVPGRWATPTSPRLPRRRPQGDRGCPLTPSRSVTLASTRRPTSAGSSESSHLSSADAGRAQRAAPTGDRWSGDRACNGVIASRASTSRWLRPSAQRLAVVVTLATGAYAARIAGAWGYVALPAVCGLLVDGCVVHSMTAQPVGFGRHVREARLGASIATIPGRLGPRRESIEEVRDAACRQHQRRRGEG
jgi:hypothetical protein